MKKHIKFFQYILKTVVLLNVSVCANLTFANAGCDHALDAVVENGCVVDEHVWRGAKPTKDAAKYLVQHGVKTIVNLELLHDDLDALDAAKVLLPEGTQLQYWRVKDWEPLVMLNRSAADRRVAKFIAITRTQSAPIYVHCRAGRNRTSVMVAAYRVFNGMPIDDAIAEMKTFNGEWFYFDAKYIRTLTTERRLLLEKQIAIEIEHLRLTTHVVCTKASCTKSLL